MKIMKAIFLLAAAALVLPVGTIAGPVSYIGLYTDASHSICEHFIGAPYVLFNVWVWVLPGDNGMICASLKIVPPGWLINTGIIYPGIIMIDPPDPLAAEGADLCLTSCQYDWAWLCQLSMMPVVAGVKDRIQVVKKPDAAMLTVNSCLEGYPQEQLIVLNDLLLNQVCYVGAENSCWGAIKSICSGR